MKIYIDLLLIQDTAIMSIILMITCKLINIKVGVIKIIAISFISTIISIFILIFFPPLFDNLLIKFSISYLIVKYGLKIKEKSTLLQKIIMFWTTSFLIGGVNIFFGGNIVETVVFVFLIFVSIYVYKINIKRNIRIGSSMSTLKFKYLNKEYELKALIDTGHDVKTIYGENVIFIRADIINWGGDNAKKRLVSYKTISGIESKYGIKVNDVIIIINGEEICQDAVLIPSTNIVNEYDAIIGCN